MRHRVAVTTVFGALLVCTTMTNVAHAEPVSDTEGSNDGADLHAGAGAEAIQWDHSENGEGEDGGSLAPVTSNWSPPPCWYTPTWTPDELREYGEENWDPSSQPPGHAQSAIGWMLQHYDHDPYEDYNSEAEGEGMWWGAVENPNAADIAERSSCSEIPFWVENEELPEGVEHALTPQVLAELAYEQIQVPETAINLSPADPEAQVVNLPTWIWANAGDYAPVSVTASLESWDIWATTTATPSGLTIDAGTSNAEVTPESGQCTINDDGSIGEPYTSDRAEEPPPCGLTYLRATHDQPDGYPLTASITWDVGWEGSDGSAEDLPDAVFETTHQIQVDEVQSIVR